MKKLIAIVLAAGFALSAGAETISPANKVLEVSETSLADVLPVWQPDGATEIKFAISRDGKPFGSHHVSFEPADDGGFTATANVDLTVKIGPITAYKYRHDSVETWKDGRLTGLEAKTRKDGKNLSARAELSEDGLSVEGTNYAGAYPETIIPANH